MASEQHKKCADVIKNTHSSLRILAKEIGPMEAWNKHCENLDALHLYAKNMKLLATNCWEKSASDPEKCAKSRITWIINYCHYYFFNKMKEYRSREQSIAAKNSIEVIENILWTGNKIVNVLDVGSCYNPFRECNFMNVLPIDLCPADGSVFICDFLKVVIGGTLLVKDDNVITQMVENYYDAVIFSLFLEYLPSSSQRKHCCEKAYKLLKTEGILIIITPDSKHVGANAKLMKNWRYTLSLMGFSRIHYEKLQYLHCMVFRKSISPEIAIRWTKLYKEDYMVDEIYIPQDFGDSLKSRGILYTKQCHVQDSNVKEIFEHLPYNQFNN